MEANKILTAEEWFDIWGTSNQMWNMAEYAKYYHAEMSKLPADIEAAIRAEYPIDTISIRESFSFQQFQLREAMRKGYNLSPKVDWEQIHQDWYDDQDTNEFDNDESDKIFNWFKSKLTGSE